MSETPDDKAARLRQARYDAGYARPADAARAMGISPPTYYGHENGARGFTDDAPRYADFFRVNLEWLVRGRGPMKKGTESSLPPERSRFGQPATTDLDITQMPRDLPVLGGGMCGEDGLFEFNGQVLDRVRRPPRLMNVLDAYALYVNGDSMSPWREQGDLVYVHPHQPVKINDYVVVQLHPESPGALIPAYIKRLVRRSANEIRLLQYNPRGEITIPAKKIKSIHKVIDWSEVMTI